MGRKLVFAYGLLSYVTFFVTFLYLIGFVGNFVVPKAIDTGPARPLWPAMLINVGLLGLFAVQHTIMARPWFKAWFTRIVPKPAERATFVLASSLILLLIVWQWRAIPAVVWDVQQPIARAILTGAFLAGWGLALYSSFLIDHFDLFGLRQVYLHLRNRPYTHPPFMVRSIYRLIRHPLMLGFLIAVWAAPTMSQGRLLFAVVITLYVFIGVRFEERDLLRVLDDDYREYRRRTPMLIPGLKLPGHTDRQPSAGPA